jgi:hypothetical protein
MPGPAGTPSRVCAHRDDILGRTRLGLRDDVAGAYRADAGVDVDGGRTGPGAQPRTVGLTDDDRRDPHVGLIAEGRPRRITVDGVGDDERHRTQLRGDNLLHAERAAATIDEHHRARNGQTVVVTGSAAEAVLDPRRHQRSRLPPWVSAIACSFAKCPIMASVVTCSPIIVA